MKHTNTKIVTDEKKLDKLCRNPFYRIDKEVYDGDDDFACYIVKMDKKKIKDDKPVHIGVAILQWSKVLFIRYVTYRMFYQVYTAFISIFRFMYWLEEHLEDGSFKTCYADTDSMALALTKSGPESADPEQSLRSLFDPIVKSSKRKSWEQTWKSWFVTTDEIWDIRKPGKLKGIVFIIT